MPAVFHELLLQATGTVSLLLDDDGALLQAGNEEALVRWLSAGGRPPSAHATLRDILHALFEDAQARELLSAPLPVNQAAVPARALRLSAPRWFDVQRRVVDDLQPATQVMWIVDRTLQNTLAHEVAIARAQQELTLSVLRTDVATLRQFLQQAGSALGFIRVTLRQPARTQQTLRDKLVLLRDEAQGLQGRAARLTLRGVAEPAQALAAALEELLARDTSSGDDLLPLALRIDAIAMGLAALSSVDEQRAPASPGPAAVAARPAARTHLEWHEACEQRFNEFVQRRGSERGVIARLRVKGSALVPERYHRQVESALEPLLDNALRHGIESPELRLAIDKPAAGIITVTFRNRDGGLEMSVHDDGRGFDVERLRDTARVIGLVDEAQAAALGPRELVGIIFRPGMGHAMSLLRESLQRHGGNVSVATKPLRYTQFNLRFADAGSAARMRPSRVALP